MVKIIAAAIRHKEVIFYLMPPARHGTIIKALDESVYRPKRIIQPNEQGFMGDDHKFYSREAAKKLVNQNGQAIADHHRTQLFSEDLW